MTQVATKMQWRVSVNQVQLLGCSRNTIQQTVNKNKFSFL